MKPETLTAYLAPEGLVEQVVSSAGKKSKVYDRLVVAKDRPGGEYGRRISGMSRSALRFPPSAMRPTNFGRFSGIGPSTPSPSIAGRR